MNPKHFHTPVSTRASCPVCHQTVYSRAGIHPQCAVRQADPPKPKNKTPKPPGHSEQDSAGVDSSTVETVSSPD